MPAVTLGIVSDIHFAAAAERARGPDYEYRGISNPLLRTLLRLHRHYVWQRNPLDQGRFLEQFLTGARGCDYAIANGDYTCDTRSVGVSDDAAFQSASECLSQLRASFPQFHGTIGDHELGKLSFVGGHGGMRLESLARARKGLGLDPLWSERIGRYFLLGVTSSLVALPAFRLEIPPADLPRWQDHREDHLDQIRTALNGLQPDDRLILFCHDPTALPYLWEEAPLRAKLHQLEQTVIGHLHSDLILRQSRLLAGMPQVRFLGHTTRRLTTALREARKWKPFRVRLCPALGGIELLKDGGFYVAELDPDARVPARFVFQSVRRH